MLTPTIASQKPRKRTGRPPECKYDCGKYGRLTRAQIAHIAGISRAAVGTRLKWGWEGERLCAGKRTGVNRKRGVVCRSTMLAAAKIARRFPDRVPTVQEIMTVHPMAESTARNWQTTFRRLQEAA
jgi:hypothetical protein